MGRTRYTRWLLFVLLAVLRARVVLNGADVVDELRDDLLHLALRDHVAALIDPELVAPHGHRARSVRVDARGAPPIDRVRDQHPRKLAVPAAYAREIRHDGYQAAR